MKNIELEIAYIENIIVVDPDGLGDIATGARIVKEQYAIVQNQYSKQYAIVTVIICNPETEKNILSFLEKEGVNEGLGKTIHIISCVYPLSKTFKDFQNIFDAHLKYIESSESYREQIKHVAILNFISTDIEQSLERLINRKLTEKGRQKTQFSSVFNRDVVKIRIGEPGLNYVNGYDGLSGRLLTQDLGFSTGENGLLFSKEEFIKKESLQTLWLEACKKWEWLKHFRDEKYDEMFVVPSYVKTSGALLYFAQILSQAPIVTGKNLLILSNVKIDEIETELKDFAYFDDYKIELINAKDKESDKKNIEKYKNTKKSIKIITDIRVSSTEHKKLLQLSSGVTMCTGDATFTTVLDFGCVPMNELRKFKIDNYKAFVDKIERYKIEGTQDLILFLRELGESFGEGRRDIKFRSFEDLIKSSDRDIECKKLSKYLTEDALSAWPDVIKKLKSECDYIQKIPYFLKQSIFLAELPIRVQKDPDKAADFFLNNFELTRSFLDEVKKSYKDNKDIMTWLPDIALKLKLDDSQALLTIDRYQNSLTIDLREESFDQDIKNKTGKDFLSDIMKVIHEETHIPLDKIELAFQYPDLDKGRDIKDIEKMSYQDAKEFFVRNGNRMQGKISSLERFIPLCVTYGEQVLAVQLKIERETEEAIVDLVMQIARLLREDVAKLIVQAKEENSIVTLFKSEELDLKVIEDEKILKNLENLKLFAGFRMNERVNVIIGKETHYISCSYYKGLAGETGEKFFDDISSAIKKKKGEMAIAWPENFLDKEGNLDREALKKRTYKECLDEFKKHPEVGLVLNYGDKKLEKKSFFNNASSKKVDKKKEEQTPTKKGGGCNIL